MTFVMLRLGEWKLRQITILSGERIPLLIISISLRMIWSFILFAKKMISHSSHITLSAQDMFINDGLIPQNEYMLYIEWGFAQTTLRYDQLSDKLKKMLLNYKSPHGGVALSIDPQMAVPDEKHRQYHFYRYNLLNSDNREILNEIFACLGLNEDATFDEFAKRFGGLTLQEIVSRMK